MLLFFLVLAYCAAFYIDTRLKEDVESQQSNDEASTEQSDNNVNEV